MIYEDGQLVYFVSAQSGRPQVYWGRIINSTILFNGQESCFHEIDTEIRDRFGHHQQIFTVPEDLIFFNEDIARAYAEDKNASW